ncbi:hypothetical protein [Terricaulis sp.]|uniref:hypothetical protein n=1 Tax=Terricaulis sp. TaxID=2768686 RepID=UPI003783AE08
MMRFSFVAMFALVLAACSPPAATNTATSAPAVETSPVQPQPQSVTVYERYAQLESDPAFQAKLALSAERIRDMDWLVGTWRTTIQVGEAAADPAANTTFRRQGDALIVSSDLTTVLGYDAFAGRWFSAGFEPPAAPMTQAFSTADWDGATLVMESDARIFGERFVLRQTLHKISDAEFEIVNEQQTAPGRYVVVDRYRYTRR